ncbi:MAG TPA: hypothetical protein VM580_03450 [Labilithrix sp.]|jgi:hypothetical protein|nr:hypothetical protein [Labilithrix sp.]
MVQPQPFFVAGQPHELGHAQSGPQVQVGPQQHSPALRGLSPEHEQLGPGHALQEHFFVVGSLISFTSPGKTGDTKYSYTSPNEPARGD